jgi:hypothetical protein
LAGKPAWKAWNAPWSLGFLSFVSTFQEFKDEPSGVGMKLMSQPTDLTSIKSYGTNKQPYNQ